MANCIGATQINDLTSQRVAHVGAALTVAGSLVDDDAPDRPALAAEIGTPRKIAVAALCRLQGRQFDRAVHEFVGEVARLKADIKALTARHGCAVPVADDYRVSGGGESGYTNVQSGAERGGGEPEPAGNS